MNVPRLPRRSFWFAFACLAIAPLVARLPGMGDHGLEWLYRYFPVVLVGAFLALAPALVAAGSAQGNQRRPIVYWFALAAGIAVMLWLHGKIEVPRYDSPGIGFSMMAIAMLSTVAILVAWPVGVFLSRVWPDSSPDCVS